jgi:26S proteasome non-ATPase regulatory subunit 9
MDDIHAPTVASGPVSGRGPANGSEEDQRSLFELMDEKDRVESEMTVLSGVLDSVCLLHDSYFLLANLFSMEST